MKAISQTVLTFNEYIEEDSSAFYSHRFLSISVEQSMMMANPLPLSSRHPAAHPLSTQFKGVQGCTLNPIIPDFTTQTMLDYDPFKL
jgi:hypothetical protein